MENFPKLIDGEVALMRADTNTGTVLDENYRYAIDDKQVVFTIFSSIDDAILFADEIIGKNNTIELLYIQ